MKRLFCIFSLLLVFILSGCDFSSKDSNFNAGNPLLNQINFTMLNSQLMKYGKKIKQSEFITINMETEVNGKEMAQCFRAKKSPIYIEGFDSSNRQLIIQEEDKIFQYTKLKNNNYDRKFIGNLSDYEGLKEKDNSEELLETVFNRKKCNITYKNGVYTVKCYYKDALNEESKKTLQEIYESINIPIENLYDSLLTMTYRFEKDKMYMDLFMIVDYEFINEPISVRVSLEIDVLEFIPLDMTDPKYNISLPDCFEEATEIYDFVDNIEFTPFLSVYLKINTEKGMIISKSEDIKLDLYDMELNKVSESMGNTGGGSYIELDSFLPVRENGTYYLVVKNRISTSKTVNLDFHPYDTVVSEEGIDLSKITTYEGEIEGKYDFEKFIYNNENNVENSLKVENLGKENIVLFKNEKWHSKDFIYVKPGETKYITLDVGYNEIFMCQNYNSNSEGYVYNVNFEIYGFALDGDILEEPIPNEFTLGRYEHRYYYTKLEKGLYSINTKTSYFSDHIIKVYDSTGKELKANIIDNSPYLYYLEIYYIIPEDGWYYVGIHNGVEISDKVYTKHDYETIGDRNNPIALDVSGVNLNSGTLEGPHDFEYYRLENESNEIKVYYITNESSNNFMVVLREYGNANLNGFNISPGNTISFASLPGEMEIIVLQNPKTALEEPIDYSFKVTEIENNNVTYFNSPNIKEVTEEYSEDFYMGGYGLPPTYMKLIMKEKGVVRFDYESYILGENDSLQNTIYNSMGMRVSGPVLEAGEYYVEFTTNDHIFSHVKIKYTFLSIEDQDIDVTLKELDSTYNNYTYSNIYNQKVTNDQVVRYHFTLTEKTTIYYNSADIIIYTEEGNLAALVPSTNYNYGFLYIDLEAGNYYFVTPKMYGDIYGNITIILIGISHIERDAPHNFSNMQILELDVEKTFKKDYGLDKEFAKIAISESDDYKVIVSGAVVYIFDENKKHITTVTSSNNSIKLEEGTYYLAMEYTSSYQVQDINICVTKK